jgi:hypothetical protein
VSDEYQELLDDLVGEKLAVRAMVAEPGPPGWSIATPAEG